MNALEFSKGLASGKLRISLNGPRHTGKLPAPGIYPDIADAEYRKIPAVSASLLKQFDESPRDAAWFLAGQYEPATPDQKFGTAAHLRLLRPDRLAGNFVLGPINEKTGKAYGRDTKTWEEAERANPGKIVLAQEDLDALNAMHGIASMHDDVGPLLTAKGQCECAIVWIDEETGLPCKALVDKYIAGKYAIDYKTAANCSARRFGYAADDYGYTLQAAHYMAGIRAQLKDSECEFVIIAQEKDGHYPVGLYTVEEPVIQHYIAQRRQLMIDLANSLSTNVWPGYTKGATPLQLPMRAMPISADHAA